VTVCLLKNHPKIKPTDFFLSNKKVLRQGLGKLEFTNISIDKKVTHIFCGKNVSNSHDNVHTLPINMKMRRVA
jgi:hypothetical protein